MLRATEFGPIIRIHMARMFLGRPLYTVEAYLVDGLLIDTGCPATAAELVDWCRGRAVRRVINTHHHEDHAGGNRALQEALGVSVSAPAEAVPLLARPPRLQPYRRVVWGRPKPVIVEPLGAFVETERCQFAVLPTPGHCSDHVCFFEPEQGWLFGGDLFIHERVRYLRVDEEARRTLESLRRVLTLRPRVLFCAHAGVIEDACRAIERKIAYWESLAEQARLLREEGLSPRRVTDRLLGPEKGMAYLTGGHFSKLNLIHSLVREET